MYCKKCGCDIAADSLYCPYCGRNHDFAKRISQETGLSGKRAEIYKEKISAATRKVMTAVNDSGSKAGKNTDENSIEKRQTILSIVLSVLLVVLSFLSWVDFLGGYGGSYSILDLLSTPVRRFYWLNDGVLFFQILMIIISVFAWVMVILDVLNVILQITKNKNRKKVEKWAAYVSDQTCITFLIIMFGTKMILMFADGMDLSGAFHIKWPAYAAVILAIMFLALSGGKSGNSLNSSVFQKKKEN